MILLCMSKAEIYLQRQKALVTIENWTNKVGLCFSAEKTRCIIFSKRGISQNLTLKFCRRQLSYTSELKYLGVIFDAKLTWKSYVNHITKTCHQRMKLLKVLAHHSWGADTDVLLRIYRTLIRPIIDYGAVAYASARETVLKPLEVIQNTAIRIALGAFRTTPVYKLHLLASEQPLRWRRNLLTLNYYLKVKENPENPVNSIISSHRFQAIFDEKKAARSPIYRRIESILATIKFPVPSIYPFHFKSIPWISYKVQYDVRLTRNENRESSDAQLTQIIDSVQDPYVVYTDASKSPEGVGIAYTTPTSIVKLRLPAESSVLAAELSAILAALNSQEVMSCRSQNIILCTDSLDSIKNLRRMYIRCPLIQNIRDALSRLKTIQKQGPNPQTVAR